LTPGTKSDNFPESHRIGGRGVIVPDSHRPEKPDHLKPPTLIGPRPKKEVTPQDEGGRTEKISVLPGVI
jgi:hypothetical protein